jgi:predicted nuclease of predicted toxin-antitoxin system
VSVVLVVVKLLLDENISPAAAVALAANGVDAWHVRDRGLEGTTDHELLDRAYQEDRILVTLNVGDFEKLARKRELHAGVVLIERVGLLRDEQIELVKSVAAALADHGDLINQVLRVAEDGAMTFENLAQKT